MRDFGLAIWVVLLVIGVISSMVSNIRKQLANAPPQGAARPPAVPAAATVLTGRPAALRRPAPVQAPARAPQQPAHVPSLVRRPPERALFGTGPELVRAVIAAEVLGKPRGLRDEY